jgi:hypothetical protein
MTEGWYHAHGFGKTNSFLLICEVGMVVNQVSFLLHIAGMIDPL